jgi:hypothetical protein
VIAQIELFELVLPYVEYRESKAVYDEAKLARDRAAVDYKRLEEENKPLKALQACVFLFIYISLAMLTVTSTFVES